MAGRRRLLLVAVLVLLSFQASGRAATRTAWKEEALPQPATEAWGYAATTPAWAEETLPQPATEASGHVAATRPAWVENTLPQPDTEEALRTTGAMAPPWAEKMLQQHASMGRVDAVVAQDGSGTFTTITKAIAAAPQNSTERYSIYVKAGVYDEILRISSDTWNLTLVGEGMGVTVITGNRSIESHKMPETATLGVDGPGFMARDLTIRNTAGPEKNQSIALRSTSKHSVVYRCALEGYQDTLYAQQNVQFYRDCKISGTVDFIYGDATAVFQSCLLLARLPLPGQPNVMTAQGRYTSNTTSGFVFQYCNATGDPLLRKKGVKTFLGRPWKEYSRTIFMECWFDDIIDPQGYLPWDGPTGLKTLFYAEYNNTGPGSATSGRVSWPGFHVIGEAEASKFTVASFIDGESWLPGTGVEFVPGL